MNTIVMSLGQGICDTIPQKLAAYQVKQNNPYLTFAAKLDGVSVSVYQSGKVVFQGKKALELAQAFGYIAENLDNPTSSGQDMPMIGTDEVGNGSYFGGIAVVASLVKPDDHAFLKQLGVDDSKSLTDQKIRQIAPLLEKEIPHKSLLLSPTKYNQVVGEGKLHNAVSVKVALHNQAIFLLLKEGHQAEKIVIDAFTSPSNYQNYLTKEQNHFPNPVSLEEKAEGKYLAVAVSSIIARKLFLENLDQLSQQIGFKLPSGAGSQSDKVASQILRSQGMSGLEMTAKCHFKNTQKALAMISK